MKFLFVTFARVYSCRKDGPEKRTNDSCLIWENNTSKACWPVILGRIKENISHYCEATIDHSQLSYQEKEDQKRQMKQSLEVYIQGVKDEMRGMGRMK